MAAWIAEDDSFDDFTFEAPLVADIVLAGDEALTGKEYYILFYFNLSENYFFLLNLSLKFSIGLLIFN